MDSNCPRCGASLQPIDDSPPEFCGRCGLPQLRISEGALPVPLDSLPGVHNAANEIRQARGEFIDWPLVLRVAGIAALIGAVPPMLLPGALTGGIAGGLALLVLPVLTLGVVSIYHRTRPRRAVSPAIGVRIGAMLGLLIGALIALTTGITGFVLRYGYRSHAMGDKVEQTTDQMLVQLSTAGPVPQDLMNFFRSPEFHAGTFLLGHAISLLSLVVVGSVCGWMAGALLRARRQRNIG